MTFMHGALWHKTNSSTFNRGISVADVLHVLHLIVKTHLMSTDPLFQWG